MPSDAARLRRLNRLERVRALAKQDALRAAAEAEGQLAQLKALAERTALIAEDYRARRDCQTGADLRRLATFVDGIAAIGTATTRDAITARGLADQRQQDLARAERSRAAAEDRIHAEARVQSQRGKIPTLTGRRAIGTGLDG
ncbi:MAG: hypothetical protein RL671_2319 [Pseudomonadota bacterium]|jgi:hypothetical protein